MVEDRKQFLIQSGAALRGLFCLREFKISSKFSAKSLVSKLFLPMTV